MPNKQLQNVVKSNCEVLEALWGPPGPGQYCVAELPPEKRVIVFFIGGAGDKDSYYFNGPFGNIREVWLYFTKRVAHLQKSLHYRSEYLGYNEVRGWIDLEENVIQKIRSKKTRVYIVGHSLGGWNGAHLAQILSDRGYSVEMLVTLDPVGEGALVWTGSDIYFRKPSPVAKYWINVLAKPHEKDGSDLIADFGEQWNVKNVPNLHASYIANASHAEALKMFKAAPPGKKSADQLLYESILKVTSP